MGARRGSGAAAEAGRLSGDRRGGKTRGAALTGAVAGCGGRGDGNEPARQWPVWGKVIQRKEEPPNGTQVSRENMDTHESTRRFVSVSSGLIQKKLMDR